MAVKKVTKQVVKKNVDDNLAKIVELKAEVDKLVSLWHTMSMSVDNRAGLLARVENNTESLAQNNAQIVKLRAEVKVLNIPIEEKVKEQVEKRIGEGKDAMKEAIDVV